MRHWCRYYTPTEVAELVANLICVESPRAVIDPAAGSGALLAAAKARYPHATVLAMDIDPTATRRLRGELSFGVVSNCDALSRESVSRSNIWPYRDKIDVVVANPPFGVLGSKHLVNVTCWGRTVRAGIASGHLLSAASSFRPKQIVAIVPSSMLHSDRDIEARELMSKYYSITGNKLLPSYAFPGNSASIRIVTFTRIKEEGYGRTDDPVGQWECGDVGPVEIIRGGVPMHEVTKANENCGMPLLHTTMIGGSSKRRPLVRPIGRGVVAGHVVLIPRVGLPRLRHLVPSFLDEHQLSDCVIAMQFGNGSVANEVCGLIQRRFEKFRLLWGGTGAQYTTIGKIVRFLTQLGVVCEVPDEHAGKGKRSPTSSNEFVTIG